MNALWKRGLAACGAVLLLALAGCGAPSQEAAPEKDHYYQILDGSGAELYTVTEADAVSKIDDLIDDLGLEDGWPGDGEGEALYTYVLYQEETLHAGETADTERDHIEVLRLTVREDGDTVTAQIISQTMEGLSDVLPQMDLQGLLTFSYDAPADVAEALRDPAQFAEE